MDSSKQERLEEFIKENLRYDPETGELWWTKAKEGSGGYMRDITKPAGIIKQGYVNVRFRLDKKFKDMRAHRVAFFLMTGRWPEIIDHINRIKSDNRWSNLREVDYSQSSRNRVLTKKSGLPLGVSLSTSPGKKPFEARIGIEGRVKYLGKYATPEEAHGAFLGAAHALGLKEYLPCA